MAYDGVTIGTTAAEIVDAHSLRSAILIQNNHASNDLYLGDDDQVTTSTGLHLPAGESMRLHSTRAVWGIASAASTDVRYYEETR